MPAVPNWLRLAKEPNLALGIDSPLEAGNMAMRAYWKGYLRLSLVNIGIELYSATSSQRRISLRQIHKPSGKRISDAAALRTHSPQAPVAALQAPGDAAPAWTADPAALQS